MTIDKSNGQQQGLSTSFLWLAILFNVCLIASNLFATKIFQIGSWCVLPGAVLIFPVSYIIHDCLSEVYGNEPPTYNCVGTSDGIASYRTMERRIKAIRANGTDAEIEIFNGLPHGFGLGIGTVAEGWINNAAAFWEINMSD